MIIARISSIALLLTLFLSLAGTEEVVDATNEVELAALNNELVAATKNIISGDYNTAEAQLKELRTKDMPLAVWAMASFNLGINLRLSGKNIESIAIFTEIIDSKVNDRDPTDNIMEHFRNYRHKACLEISMNYEALSDIQNAKKYIELARDKFIFQDICGNCLEKSAAHLDRRITHLNKENNK